jgi:hypothetical protein
VALGAEYQAGQTIEVSRMVGGFVSTPDQGCDASHYHADFPGVLIDGVNGSYVDPARSQCGFGKVVLIPQP